MLTMFLHLSKLGSGTIPDFRTLGPELQSQQNAPFIYAQESQWDFNELFGFEFVILSLVFYVCGVCVISIDLF